MTAAAAGAALSFNPDFAQAVSSGLCGPGQKTLPPAWFYDEVGSALFEVITVLPEYGLTRSEASLLADAAADIVDISDRPSLIIELGSGSGTKTRHILEATARHLPVNYFPVDISCAALRNCAKILQEIDGVTIHPVEGTYLDGIDAALDHRRAGQPALVLFLGSTIGNFTPAEAQSFLACIRARLRPGDSLLLGADLVKPRELLLRAYDDSLGVTAAFNLNLLARINRELAADFDLSRFAHEARWNARDSRIEMHLRSRVAQTVRINTLGMTVSFTPGETIWTESSHKFRPEALCRLGEHSGFANVRQWTEPEWGFAETLFRASSK